LEVRKVPRRLPSIGEREGEGGRRRGVFLGRRVFQSKTLRVVAEFAVLEERRLESLLSWVFI
jgi:hypothetical protein